MDTSSSTLYTLPPEKNPTLSPDQQITQKPPPNYNDAAPQDLLAAGRSRGRRRRTNKISKDACIEDEKDEVEKRIGALQKIVPGGEKLPVAELFEETAEYILALESQVKALRFFAALVQGSANKKRMRGG